MLISPTLSPLIGATEDGQMFLVSNFSRVHAKKHWESADPRSI